MVKVFFERHCISVVLVIFFSVSIQAQSISNSFYKHFTGTLDTNMQITVDLNCTDNQISGYYYYSFEEPDSDSIIHFGKTLPLHGEITDLTINLHEFGNTESKFSGKFQSNKNITGYWVKNSHEKTIPFNISENYKNGSLVLSSLTKSDQQIIEIRDVHEKNCPRAKMDISILYPDLQSGSPLKDTFDIILTEFLINEPILLSSPDILLKDISFDFFNSYKIATDGIEDLSSTASFNWEKKVSMNVKYNENNILALKIEKYAFTGGAHGISMVEYVVIDINSKKRLTKKDIFKDDAQSTLSSILEKKLRTLNGIMPEDSLRKSGFLVDKIEANDNFYINNDGIGFFYNVYAIAPYASGTTELFLYYEEMKELLKPNHPFSWRNI